MTWKLQFSDGTVFYAQSWIAAYRMARKRLGGRLYGTPTRLWRSLHSAKFASETTPDVVAEREAR